MGVLAVIAARNEVGYIATTLQTLISEGIEVALIDHGSIDGTRERAMAFLGAGLLAIVDLPWQGVFDLGEQLLAKQALYERSRHDWHMPVDADEWLRSTAEMPLGTFLVREVDPRYLVVNFREYVFVPPPGVDMWMQDFRRIATRHYAFEPRQHRLMRAWRRGAVGSNVSGGGHGFPGVSATAVYPEDQTLRNYLGLSWSQAITRRANRVYSSEDLSRRWHARRLDMRTAPDLGASVFRTAVPWDARQLDHSEPSLYNLWESGFGRVE